MPPVERKKDGGLDGRVGIYFIAEAGEGIHSGWVESQNLLWGGAGASTVHGDAGHSDS